MSICFVDFAYRDILPVVCSCSSSVFKAAFLRQGSKQCYALNHFWKYWYFCQFNGIIPITTHDVVAEKLIPFICKIFVQITVFHLIIDCLQTSLEKKISGLATRPWATPMCRKSIMLKSANVIRFGFKVVLTVFSSDYYCRCAKFNQNRLRGLVVHFGEPVQFNKNGFGKTHPY